jgi:hypothetical protein
MQNSQEAAGSKSPPQQNPFYAPPRQSSGSKPFSSDTTLPMDAPPPNVNRNYPPSPPMMINNTQPRANRNTSLDPPLPLETPTPKRLPPVNLRQPSDSVSTNKTGDLPDSTPVAPLPP